MSANKFIKSVRSANPTGKPLRALSAAYESRSATTGEVFEHDILD